MEEIIETGKAARDKLIREDFESCVRVLEKGNVKAGTAWDAVALIFEAMGFRVERVEYAKNVPDGESTRWWVYAQPAVTAFGDTAREAAGG